MGPALPSHFFANWVKSAVLFVLCSSPNVPQSQMLSCDPVRRHLGHLWEDNGAIEDFCDAFDVYRIETSKSPSIPDITDTISTVLGIPPADISPTTNIFDIGANSLNITELAWRLAKASGQPVESEDLYQALTPAGIAAFLVQKLQAHAAADPQAEVDALIERFGAPFESVGPQRERDDAQQDSSATTVLLTGATGSLGSHILSHLLSSYPSLSVTCLVRGDPLPRLHSAFAQRALDSTPLDRALQSGALTLLSTTSLADDFLGCTESQYAKLADTVDVVLHCAWRLDFNVPLTGFAGDIRAARRLAQLCASSVRAPMLWFTSSISTVFAAPMEPVPERPLEPRAAYALKQGYAQAKLVAEHVSYRLHAAARGAFALRVVRVGQLCGDTVAGCWSTDEMAPMLLASLPALRAMPREMPAVSWIPADVCARALCELALDGAAPTARDDVDVFNLANPHITPWADVCAYAAHAAGCDAPRLVPFAEYVALVERASAGLPVARLLPYFKRSLADHASPATFRSLDVSRAMTRSAALAACPAIDREFAAFLMQRVMGAFKAAGASAASSPETLPTPDTLPSDVTVSSFGLCSPSSVAPAGSKQYVFVFGPWSERVSSDTDDDEIKTLLARLHTHASLVLASLGDKHDPALHSAIDLQLRTLAHQLAMSRRLLRAGIAPAAVAGYSFGEFAAAVVAGILTEARAAELVAARAAAVHVAGAGGAMLNVFAPPQRVRAQLAALAHPAADVAIYAGPTHVVLGGSVAAVAQAQERLQEAGLKCVRVATGLPFHCRAMDGAVRALRPLLPEVAPAADARCAFVSGVTGGVLPARSVGAKYWLRHMREPVRFYGCMETVRGQFAGCEVVDVGPGPMVRKIVGKYGWADVTVRGPEEYAASEGAPRSEVVVV